MRIPNTSSINLVSDRTEPLAQPHTFTTGGLSKFSQHPAVAESSSAPPRCVLLLRACSGCRNPPCSWGGSSRRPRFSLDTGLRPRLFHRQPPSRLRRRQRDKFLLRSHDDEESL